MAPRHYEGSVVISASPESIFAFIDDHSRFSSHMSQWPEQRGSRLRVFIDYELPNGWLTYWLGLLFGGLYAKWCVKQMLAGHHATSELPVQVTPTAVKRVQQAFRHDSVEWDLMPERA